jgi:hypothetical protein
MVCVRPARALRLATISARIASTAPSRPFGAPPARPDWAARAALTASSGPGLARPAPVLPVGAVHLHHPHTSRGDVAGQAGAVAAGPFDPDQAHGPEPAQPRQQAGISGCSGRELPDTEQPADRVQRCCDVHVGVGVHAASDGACHLRWSTSSPSEVEGWHAPAGHRALRTPASCPGQADQTGTTGGCQRPGARPTDRVARQPQRRQPNSRSGRDPGTRPYAPTSSKRGKQGRSTIHTLPADSERKAAVLVWRGGAARSGGYGHPVVGAAAGKDGSAAGRADAANWPGAGRAERRGCILVVLLWTLAAASAECAVYRKVWSSFLLHVSHSGAGGWGHGPGPGCV